MLFRALIDRLLGSTDSQNHDDDGEVKTARVTYNDYPKLLDIVTELLTPDSDAFGHVDGALESVFPALKIIQRMPPPELEQKRIRDLVFRLCVSSHWHIRTMAAFTFASLVSKAEVDTVLRDLVPLSRRDQNDVHGRLLCIDYLMDPVFRNAACAVEGTSCHQHFHLIANNRRESFRS